MNNLHILRRDLKDWSIMPDTAEQSYWLKGMPLLIMRRYQLALTSCVARCRFGRLVLVAINHTELLWNAIQSSGAAWQRWFSVSRLTFRIIYFGSPCVHTGLWKRLVKNRVVWGEEGFECSPVPPATSISREAQHASIWREREGVLSLHLPCLWIFSPPVTEEACYQSTQT